MDRDAVEVNKLAKKERGQYPAILTAQAWSIKDLLYGFQGNFSCGTRRVVPSGQDSSILPAHGASHIIRSVLLLIKNKYFDRQLDVMIHENAMCGPEIQRGRGSLKPIFLEESARQN